ncbi:hypothetical protein LZK98_11645 [Sphingomonas cannabina]|uniref:hypothetical protein n=1 Tax=Sphingomonas cannabina TaxID=2899123 RepID=UPI001F37AC01|nr:hypothetical protein [Sphingomonas cannabina]UIJ43744.1 hypothetical protein LZK98_11645 [Sphingomonas cannabina]
MTNHQAPEQPEAADGAERLGECLFELSDHLRRLGVLDDDAAHVAYEKVVAAFSRLSPPQGTEQGSYPSPAAGVGREEEIARIIDPDAWHEALPTDGLGHWHGRRKRALTKVDAILALLHPSEGSVG